MLSATIMAHPQRVNEAGELLGSLDRPVEIVWDQNDDIWDTGRRALLSFDPSATWHLILQDDALVCQELCEGIERLLFDHQPDHPASFYLTEQMAERFKADALSSAGGRWLIRPGPWGALALVVPTDHIPEIVAWGDRREDVKSFDKRIARWYEHKQTPCWYYLPSCVTHRHPDECAPIHSTEITYDRPGYRFPGTSFALATSLEASCSP